MRRRAAILSTLLCALAWPAAAAAHPDSAGRAGGGRHVLVFGWPALGAVTTPFEPGRHEGIDIGSLHSLEVTAAHGGRVLHVGYTTGFEGYGKIVDVEVEPGIETLYAHLSTAAVRVGELVRGGQPVGTAGCTGMCTGTHLHFEVREHGKPVNPRRFLP